MTRPAPEPTATPSADAAPARRGARGTFSRTVTQSDITLYAGLTGDFAPHHVDAAYARTTRFGTTIAHGLFTASLVDGALAALFPQGTLPVRRELRFTAPVRPGDTITVLAEVVEVDEGGRVVTLATTCTNQQGEVVVIGTAAERVAAPELPPPTAPPPEPVEGRSGHA